MSKKCEVPHCVREADGAFVTITDEVWLCAWHSYWQAIPQQRSGDHDKVSADTKRPDVRV